MVSSVPATVLGRARPFTLPYLPFPLLSSPPLPILSSFSLFNSVLVHVCMCDTNAGGHIPTHVLRVSSLLLRHFKAVSLLFPPLYIFQLGGRYNSRQSSCLPPHLIIGVLGLQMCLMASCLVWCIQRLNYGCQAYTASTLSQ